MADTHNSYAYAPDGTPQDFFDNESKVLWIYQGKSKDGSDHWGGIPCEA